MTAQKLPQPLSGTVLDENNQPVSSASVLAGTSTVVTDAMGNFVLRNAVVSGANGFVTVSKTGYFKGIRSFVTEAGKNNFVKIQLIKRVLSGTITAGNGGSVTVDGATIAFPADAFVTASGAPYIGPVKVYAARIDPTASNLPLVVPGDLRGIDSTNGEYLLKSYGMVGAELTDASGNPLKIAPNKKASIVFPIPASLQATAPESIPLWHFDDATARWKEEGTATKLNNSYVASVGKFSFWNVDVPGNFVSLDLRLVNSANNRPLVNTLVKVTSLATNTYAYDYTNDSGYVSGYVPKNENLKMEVIGNTQCASNSILYVQNIGPYSANTSLGNVAATIPSTFMINFTAAVKNCNNQPVTNGYVSIRLANGSNVIALTDMTGMVSTSLPSCGNTNTGYTYQAVDLGNSSYGNVQTGTANSNTVALGNVSACGNTINTNGVYIGGHIGNNAVLWKDGMPTYLTNFPANSDSAAGVLGVQLVNNDLYIAIVVRGDTSQPPKYVVTKNGTAIYAFSVSSNREYLYDFLVSSSGDCYFDADLGYITSSRRYWKNGVYHRLPLGTYTSGGISSMCISGNDFYAVGVLKDSNSYKSRPVYWKNGILNDFINQSDTSDYYGTNPIIFAENNNIYISGSYSYASGTADIFYWKNNQKFIFPVNFTYHSYISHMFVNSNDVYFGGYEYSNPGSFGYWKNGVFNSLYPTNSTRDTDMTGIMVKNNTVHTIIDEWDNSVKRGLYFQNGVLVPQLGIPANTDYGYTALFVN